MKKLRILVFASSRADYSLLKWILIKKNTGISFDFISSSITKNKNHILKTIENDKIRLSNLIKLSSSDTHSDRSSNILKIIRSISNQFEKINYSYLLILGDRYEVFASAIAANNFQIPIIHLSGGLLSLGSQDEYYRHSITKLSTYHFTTSKKSRKRVIQMGEEPSRVFNYGSLGIESIKNTKFINRKIIYKKLGINLLENIILITFHPNTDDGNQNEIDHILLALKKIENTSLVFTPPNFDPGYKDIIFKIKTFVNAKKNAYYLVDLKDTYYLSILKLSKIILGNSSSGFYQAPYLKVPTLNIGNRQMGREGCQSIISIKSSSKEILKYCSMILNKKIKFSFNNFPYGNGNTSKKIISKIKKLPKENKVKNFFNLDF